MAWYFVVAIVIAAMFYIAIGLLCFKEIFRILGGSIRTDSFSYEGEMPEVGLVIAFAALALIAGVLWPITFAFIQQVEAGREAEEILRNEGF